MKRFAILFVILACVTMSGCLVSALHPFYTNKDKTYDENFNGNWMDEDSCIWVIEDGESSHGFMDSGHMDSTFFITYYEEGTKTYLKGTIFELEGKNYIDFFPEDEEEHFTSEMSNFHHLPVHTLARIEIKDDRVLLFWFGEEWLNELFEENRIRIAHETVQMSGDYTRQVLTAPTEELQKFISKYANEEEITKEIELAFSTGEGVGSDYDGNHAFVMLAPYNGPIPEDQ